MAENANLHAQLVRAAYDAADGAVLDLHELSGSGWDRVALIPPYGSNGLVEDLLGVPFDVEAVSPWTHSEGGTVFVLADNEAAVGWFLLPWSELDAGCAKGVVLTAADARFVVVVNADGSRSLVAETVPTCAYMLPAG
jgi:hypothetical protein